MVTFAPHASIVIPFGLRNSLRFLLQQLVGRIEPISEGKEILDGLLVHKLPGEVLSFVVPRASQCQKLLGLFLGVNAKNGEEPIGTGTTVPDDNGSENLDLAFESVGFSHLPSIQWSV